MAIWKKQLHIAVIFILILSLFSPSITVKAQHFEGEIFDSIIEDTSDIELNDSPEQGNAIESNNEPELDNSAERDNVLESENEVEHLMPLQDAIEFAPFSGSEIQLNTEKPLLLLEGETYPLTVTDATTEDSAIVVWSSSKPNIATVDVNGLVTGIAIGDAEITIAIGAVSKTIKVHVIPEAVKETIDLIIALPDELEPTETIYQQLLTIREKETNLSKLKIRDLFDNTSYDKLLRQREVEFTIKYMEDPANTTPAVEEITTLDENLSDQLEKIRKVYTSFFSISGRYQPTDLTLEALNYALANKEVKYAILAIDTLPKIGDLTPDPTIKVLLDYARKKYESITSVRPTPPLFPGLPPGNESFKVDVTNRQELFDKEVKYVELLIDAIDTNSPLVKNQLKAANDAYSNLKKLKDASNKAQHTKVSNYNDLLEKEKIINAEGDINQVIAKIDALPSVEELVWADYLKIFEAQQAYDQLLAIHKELVTNYAKLGVLQKRLIQLQPPTVDTYTTVAEYLTKNLNSPGYGYEWTMITLARGDHSAKYATYYDQYYRNIVNHVKATNGEIDKQATDWARVIIALTAIGKDPTDVAGYNLVDRLADLSFITGQGINATIYSLIALDTWGFELPATATTTRDKLIQHILSKEIQNSGGFAWSGSVADPDMIGMVLQALAPYQNRSDVAAVTNRAIAKLAAIQTANGGYISTAGSSESAESAAQVVTALASLGIDANKDPRFNKVIANMMTFSAGDGGFKHIHSQSKADGMGTVQVGYTLAAYNRLLSGQTALYDMSDTKDRPSTPGDKDGDGDDDEEPSPPDNNGNQPSVPSEEIGYATVSIRISSSEVPLKPTATKLFAGETAFDVLQRAAEENGVALSYRQTEYGIYVDGIAGLYEFDRGPLSGWMYRVNGKYPSYSAANYTLSPNDAVEWLYTTDLGKDIGGYVEGIEDKPAVEEEKKQCAEEATENCLELEEKLCTDEECIEESKNESNKEKEDSSVVEITIEENANKVVLTPQNIQEYMDKNIQKLVIQKENQFKLEVATSVFAGIKLAESENIIAAVTKETGQQQFTVTFGIETKQGNLKPISLGKEYLKVTLPANDLKPNSVVLQLVGDEYKPVPHKIVDGEIVLFTKAGGTFVIIENAVTFKDIAHLANKEEIEFLANRLVIKGVTPDTFGPTQPITRAQLAALVSRALGLQATGTNPFRDTAGKWYEADIQALYEAGITNGVTATAFNPQAHITREQAAAFMARVLEYLNADMKNNNEEIHFKDIHNISAEYLPYIELLNSLDIMTGKTNGSFDPKTPLTREQTAKILKRTLNTAGMM